jgi:hypothetical protein
MQDTNNMLHAPCILLETKQISSHDFHNAMNNKGVIRGNHVKWCSQEIFMVIDP